MSVKVIPTIYNGITYRSRTEARWAVFFDSLGIQHEYEKEGYDLDGEWYLPDFHIGTMIVEIKGFEPTLEEKTKARKLSEAIHCMVLILSGSPNLFSEHLACLPPPEHITPDESFTPNEDGWGWHYFRFIDDRGVKIHLSNHKKGIQNLFFSQSKVSLFDACRAAKNERFGVHPDALV